MSLTDLSATDQLGRLEAGEVTSVELVNAHLTQIDQYDERVGAFLNVDRDGALQRAEQIDASRRRGERLGRLAGLPVAVKDVVCTKGQPTTCASRMLEHFVPPYDATVVSHLKRAGAVQLGKTNMDEFAMGGSTENSAFHITRNPWDLARTPGGSSGGAAACVAARMAPLSVGSDTGGSIRQPAGLCGAVGMKPTYGRVSRYGLVAFASSLDQIGPLARTAEDCALLLEVLAGYDANDSTSVDRPVPPYCETLTKPVRGLKLGLVREHFENGSNEGLDGDVEAAVREAVRAFESLGATVHDVSLPHSKYAVATYYVIAPSEASSNLARYDGVHFGYRTDRSVLMAERDRGREPGGESGGPTQSDESNSGLVQMVRRTRSEGFGAEVQRRIMLGTYALSAGYYDAYYLKALKARRLIRQDYDEAFGEVDLLIGPVTAAPAFPLGQWTDDPLAMYLVDLFTVGANLAGIPGICIPCGQSQNGLPVGLQLLAAPFQEERLLQAAHAFQQATDWHARKPELISS